MRNISRERPNKFECKLFLQRKQVSRKIAHVPWKKNLTPISQSHSLHPHTRSPNRGLYNHQEMKSYFVTSFQIRNALRGCCFTKYMHILFIRPAYTCLSFGSKFNMWYWSVCNLLSTHAFSHRLFELHETSSEKSVWSATRMSIPSKICSNNSWGQENDKLGMLVELEAHSFSRLSLSQTQMMTKTLLGKMAAVGEIF